MKREEKCGHCGYQWNDVGDAAIFFVMFFLCIVATAAALFLIFALGVPMWLGIVATMTVVLASTPILLRIATMATIRLNYRHRLSAENQPYDDFDPHDSR